MTAEMGMVRIHAQIILPASPSAQRKVFRRADAAIAPVMVWVVMRVFQKWCADDGASGSGFSAETAMGLSLVIFVPIV